MARQNNHISPMHRVSRYTYNNDNDNNNNDNNNNYHSDNDNYPARALRALGLLLADSAPTVGGGKTF